MDKSIQPAMPTATTGAKVVKIASLLPGRLSGAITSGFAFVRRVEPLSMVTAARRRLNSPEGRG